MVKMSHDTMSSYLTSELIVLRKHQTSVEVLRVQGGGLEGECRYLRN